MEASKNCAMVLVALLVVGCTTATGMGTGRSRAGTASAIFTWKQDGTRSGRMTASLDTGEIYVGPLFEITRETRVAAIEPLWQGWDRPWPGWEHWGPEGAFISHYNGAVVANLIGPDGHLRCRVRLTRPTAGMAGGGGGHCQLPDGRTFGATFPPLGWPG
ncbi:MULTISPECIES: hypothetical protein [unclassified Phenylobacterium]|uniref:hypothetical protein n=1 Tax=unclassified Phenylobacterium TaxID=2640670 RepID=UPI00083AA570|nr:MULTISPECIES: hypothetical protein [unclassified Phenylobacterium]